MKIELNQDGTYALTVTTDEDQLLFDALSGKNFIGQKIHYGGRSGCSEEADYHLILNVNGQRFALREDEVGGLLGYVRDAIYYGGYPTVLAFTYESDPTITVGINKCKGCGNWKHGFAGHCDVCVKACDHTHERQWTLSPALGQVMALICTKCGQIDADDFERLKGMEQIDRLVEVADETDSTQFIYPAGKDRDKFGLGVEVHRAQEVLRATKE